MTIDGIIINPTKFYTFNKDGQHIIYFSFNKYSKNSSFSDGSGIFSGVENLKNVEFSNYSQNYPDVRFTEMFNNCKNLESVDLSHIKLDYHSHYECCNFYYYYSVEYFNSMDYMFNNCTSLKSLNFDFKKNNCTYIYSSKFMFNNCTSLTYISLYSLCFTCHGSSFDINNMFSNCISLKTVVLNDFTCYNNYINMSYMFYNCPSLVSLSIPSEDMDIPYDMSYSFANCSSLKRMDLDFSGYFSQGKTFSNAFRNCTSLVSVNLNFYFDYEDISYAFMGCTNLETIDISIFCAINVKYMTGMFYGCYSLNVIDFLSYELWTHKLIDISYMFSGCYSLKKINLTIIADNIKNYQGLFYDCYSLYNIDISSFTHNNLSDSNLSIFNGDFFYDYDYIKPTLFINKEFLNRTYIPSHFNIVIKNKTDFI